MSTRSKQPDYDPKAIRALFDEMSSTYGIVNLISSFGFTVRWRHALIRNVPLAGASHIVDLMSGMNENCRSILPHVSPAVRLTAVDISPQMVRKARKGWPFEVTTILGDVLTWESEPGSADVVLCSFGLKTFDHSQQALLSQRLTRLLRPGGAFSFVEISVPPARVLRAPYLYYLHCVIPWVGRLFLGNPANYRLLGVYTEAFGTCHHFAECLRQQGIEVCEVSYFFGCATGIRGTKPLRSREEGLEPRVT
jgi:ubiquinone/menaquinone biosynthesis C-methylase UbiE